MNSNKNLWIAVVVVAIIALLGTFFPKVSERIVEKTVGSITGPESPYEYECNAGVCTYYAKSPMIAATTTPCALKSPSATSTLIGFMATFRVATATAATVDVATSTDAFSTTSPQIVKAFSVGANAQATIQTNGTTTSYLNTNAQNNLIGPNNFVVLKTAGPGEAGYTWGGACTAIFQTAE